MQFDYSRIWPYVIATLAVLLIYRRLRRTFGRQPLRPVRMRLRIGILLVLGGSLLPAAMRSAQFLTAELAGVTVGIALGIWGAQRTRYQTHNGRLHYIPHTYTGIVVSLLLVGRLAYRLVEVYGLGHSTAAGDSADMPALDSSAMMNSSAMMRSPITVGLLFVVVGYYVCYYSLVLWKSKRISPEDLEAVQASTVASS
jgi:hypothetical protein